MAFALNQHDLDNLFRDPKFISDDIDPDSQMYPDHEYRGCTDTLEFFINDIRQNLMGWATDSISIFYKTERNHYKISPSKINKGLLDIFATNEVLGIRIATWANKSTLSGMGKEFLGKEENLKKRMELLMIKR